MNTPPHSSPDSTPDPLQPDALDDAQNHALSQENASDGASNSETNGQTNGWDKARSDLDALLGDDDQPTTIFDQELVATDDEYAEEDDEYDDGVIEIEEIEEKALDEDDEDEIYAAGYVEPRGSRWPAVLIFLLLVGGIGGTAFYYKQKAEAKEARRWASIAMPDKMAFVPTDWGAATLGEKLKGFRQNPRHRSVRPGGQRRRTWKRVQPGGYASAAQKPGRAIWWRCSKRGQLTKKRCSHPAFTGIQITESPQKRGLSRRRWVGTT